MMTILDTIVEHKKMEVLKRKGRKNMSLLIEKEAYKRAPLDPGIFFHPDKANIIAEFKRRSPSKGVLSDQIDPVPVVRSYRDNGASASSILTDRDFFGGSFRDLENVKKEISNLPLLRKDFIIDVYQVHEAKAYGADMILLIAAILSKKELALLAQEARSIGLSVLLEVHNEEEIDKWVPGVALVGVNNRDLRDFSVDLERSVKLLPKLPQEAIKVTESGIHLPEDAAALFRLGYRGFLMGEKFMKADDPGDELANFLSKM